MKTDKNILIAFILNLGFSIFEFIGGFITNSIAIISDSIHDLGDAMSIGISYFLEKKSKRKPDNNYTYGYVRYSVIGSLITTIILILGSVFIIYNGINRIINPVEVNYNGMIIFAVIGVLVNLLATYYTKEGQSLNQKSVNLHMLEDVLSWFIVLIGSIIIKFTNITIIDPVLSIFVGLFIFKNSITNFKLILDLFLEKIPKGISINELKQCVLLINGVIDVHHIHVWSIDGYNNCATMHIITNNKNKKLKEEVKEKLKEYNINHTTIELENENENCHDENCYVELNNTHHHH